MARSSCTNEVFVDNFSFHGIKKPYSRMGSAEFRKFVVSKSGSSLIIRWYHPVKVNLCKGEGRMVGWSKHGENGVEIKLHGLDSLILTDVFYNGAEKLIDDLGLLDECHAERWRCPWFSETAAAALLDHELTSSVSSDGTVMLDEETERSDLLARLKKFENLYEDLKSSDVNSFPMEKIKIYNKILDEHTLRYRNWLDFEKDIATYNKYAQQKIQIPEIGRDLNNFEVAINTILQR